MPCGLSANEREEVAPNLHHDLHEKYAQFGRDLEVFEDDKLTRRARVASDTSHTSSSSLKILSSSASHTSHRIWSKIKAVLHQIDQDQADRNQIDQNQTNQDQTDQVK